VASDSLIIADLIEVLGGASGVQSDIPALVNAAGTGAVFRLFAPSSPGSAASPGMTWDLGAPQPTVSQVQTLLLDGERPFGTRASNRTITLPVRITAPDQATLSAAKEYLIQAVDQPSWTLTWTPSSTGLTQVFDCFRALPTVFSYGFLPNQPLPMAVITLTFQALPYGRSAPDQLTDVAFSSPILNGIAAPPAPVTLDAFGTVSGTGWTQTTQFVVGPHSARYTPPNANYVPVTYSKSGLSLNITGLPVLSVWFGQAYYVPLFGKPHSGFKSNVTFRWTLTDNGGHKLTFHRTFNGLPYNSKALVPKWTRVTAPVPQGNASFNYASVASYSLTLSNWAGQGKTAFVRMNAWLDDVVANPPSLAAPASQRGVVYNVMGVPGTARTPVSCQFQLPQADPLSLELSGSGVWWPPPGVTSVKAECIGAGGAGGSRSTSGQGGGGGGGEYAAEPALTVTEGTPVPYSCGTAGTTGASQQVLTFTSPGSGSWTCPANVTAILAECWAGGGAGTTGGGGAGGGEYAAEPALAVTPGKTYSFKVGLGGQAGVTPGAGGTSTTFPGDSVTVLAHPGKPASPAGTSSGGAGGSGSANTTHHNGGTGGTSPSYGGGGGGGGGGTAAAGNTGSNGAGNTGGAGAVAVTGGGAGGAGASNPGFPAAGAAPGGGGGGGYTNLGNNPGAAGGAGQVRLTYTVNAGTPVSGASTTFGSAATTVTVVTAHGGQSVALNTATGGTGGTGSANTTHCNGGAGGLGGTNGGGGGGSGGSASVGNAGTAGASGGTGAAAVAGGGKGANGGTAAVDVGDGASPPGGGGGGAVTTGTAQAGGQGGNGNIVLTWSPPLAQFRTLVAHRPGADSPPELNPCVPVSNTADPPSGTQYTVPSLVSGVNALFNGTYTVVLVAYAWDSPSSARTVTVTVNQFEYLGGHNFPLSVSRTFTPSTDIVNGIVVMGELTLPVKGLDPSNTSGFFTVSITDTDNNDQFLDVLFLDAQGSTVIINVPPGTDYANFYIDEPTIERDLGLVLGSDLDRSQAVSVLDNVLVSGSPFYIQPGDNLFLAYTVDGAPDLAVSFLNRWFLERLV
jgi:hypothetical protein